MAIKGEDQFEITRNKYIDLLYDLIHDKDQTAEWWETICKARIRWILEEFFDDVGGKPKKPAKYGLDARQLMLIGMMMNIVMALLVYDKC
jgi:hypothetical protein